jgi:adenylosuccinate synthase
LTVRSGIRVHEIFDQQLFEAKLRKLAAGYKKRFGDLLVYDVEEEIGRFREYRKTLAPFCIDAVKFMKDAQDRNAKILVEGANALMLDIDYGENIRPL